MNDLLMYIDKIDQSVNDTEINVLESLINSYDKSIMILESYEGNDYSSFDIFQEGEKWDKFKEDTKAPILGNKGESKIKRILMIIPRLIQKLVVLVRKLFKKNNNIEQKMENDIQKLENEAKKTITKEPTKEQIKEALNKTKDNPSINIKSREEIGKMLDNMKSDETLQFGPKGVSVVKVNGKKSSTDKFIKDFLDEAGVEVPEIPMSEKILSIEGSPLFWQFGSSDSTNFGLSSDFYNRSSGVIPELGYSQQGDIDKLLEYTKYINDSIGYIDGKINSVIHGGSDGSHRIHIKFGDAVNMMKKMKEMFDMDYKSMSDCLKRINAELPKFNEREKEIEERFVNEVQSDNFNPDTSLTVKESDAMSKYLMALTSLQLKLDNYCQAVLRRWNIDYQKIMTAIGNNETDIKLN